MTDVEPTEEGPSDVFSITPSEGAHADVRTGLMRMRLDEWDDEDVEWGITVYQDGPYLALSNGAARAWERDDDMRFYVHNALTPEQAREIAGALEAAADRAEEAPTIGEPDRESFLQRLLP